MNDFATKLYHVTSCKMIPENKCIWSLWFLFLLVEWCLNAAVGCGEWNGEWSAFRKWFLRWFGAKARRNQCIVDENFRNLCEKPCDSFNSNKCGWVS